MCASDKISVVKLIISYDGKSHHQRPGEFSASITYLIKVHKYIGWWQLCGISALHVLSSIYIACTAIIILY